MYFLLRTSSLKYSKPIFDLNLLKIVNFMLTVLVKLTSRKCY